MPPGCWRAQEAFGAWLHEAHHAAKKDAPSGTALKLKRAMEEAGYHRPIDVAASRAGFIPGTHTIGFDGPSESITLTHTARDRGGFARGALTAARWIKGRRGWFTMEDVLGTSTSRLRLQASGFGLELRLGDRAEARSPKPGASEDHDMRTNWTGVGTAMVTPFTASGDLDEAAVRRLGRRQIDAGIHFLVPCGTTGESPDAHRRRARAASSKSSSMRRAGEVPVLAGAGGYDTREVIELADRMREVGASGLLSVTPYYNKPTQEGLYQHYRAIAESTPLPIILYNVPGRTGVNIETRTLLAAGGDPEHRRRQGSLGQHHADVRGRARSVPGRFHRAVRRRCDHAAADGDRRPRHHLGGVERNSRRDGRRWSKPPSAAISRRRAPCITASCR